MKKNFFRILILIILIIGALGYFLRDRIFPQKASSSALKSAMDSQLQGRKAAMIIAFKDFRDEEYFVPKKILENSGIEIKTVSNFTGKAIGADGGEADVDLLLNDLKVDDFDAIVLIGGPGAVGYVSDEKIHAIFQEAAAKSKITAAICVGPAVLAKAGILNGKKATVWSSTMDKSLVKILKDAGADYQNKSTVVDGKIVTANGPAAAQEFGEKIIEAVSSNLTMTPKRFSVEQPKMTP